jgi:2-phospho-L-lactate guanylyltransferase
MSAGRIRVVIPMKPLDRCKMRLAQVLEPKRRAGLTVWMLSRVIAAAAVALGSENVSVMGGDGTIRTLCEQAQVVWESDPAGDLNGTLDAVRQASIGLGWQQMLFLAGDIPTLQAVDVQQLVDVAAGVDVLLGAGARGGTNALLLRTELNWFFQLGPQSLRHHCEQAESRGLRWKMIENPAIYADVDTPGDLAWLEEAEPSLWQQVTASTSTEFPSEQSARL